MKTERGFWQATIVLFAALAVLLYLPVLAGRVPFPRDIVLQFPAWNRTVVEAFRDYADIGDLITAFYPSRAFMSKAIHEGTLPLWNPYLLSGTPFQASPQSSLFYPPNVLYYILPLPVAWTLCLMLRVFLAGVFMTLFVRAIGGSRAGSLFSGISFTLCGFLTAWQGQPMADSATWLPLMCYAVLRLAKPESNGGIALAAFAFAMPVLAGHPETAAHVTLVAIAMAVVTWASLRFDLRFAWRFLAAGALAGGLASIQMIPTLEWLAQMPGALAARWPLLPMHQVLAWVSRDMIRGPNSAGVQVPEAAAYAGMLTLIVAPLGLLHRAKRHVLFLAILTITALAIAYGVEPAYSLVAHIPVLSGVKNGRMIFLAGFGIAALAGLGISVLEEDVFFGSRRLLAFSIVMATAAGVFLLVYDLRLATEIRIELIRRPSFSRAMLIAGTIPVLLRLYGRLKGTTFSSIACAIVAFDLMTFAYGYTGFATPREIFPNAPVFDFLAKNAEPARFRVAQLNGPFPANANMVYGLASADGYEVRLTPLPHALALDYMAEGDGIFFTADRLSRFNDRRLDLFNVKYLVLPPDSREFHRFLSTGRYSLAYNDGDIAALENRTALPRAFVVPLRGMRVVPEINGQLAVLKDPTFDPQYAFTVSKTPDGVTNQPQNPMVPGLPLSHHAELIATHINDIAVRAASSEPSALIFSQTYYPGWHAEVDGRRTEVFPVDVALTGLIVPSGLHDIRLVFRPASFVYGAALSVISLVVLVVIGLTGAKRLIRGGYCDSRV
ncbi:MAG TPA: YfhO family protein [Terriglobia bacterium]